MAASLRIDDLTLVTPANRFTYSFDLGINAVIGEIGSGKSSLLELIKYALGGNATITPAVSQGVRRVVLRARIGSTTVVLDREIGGRTIRALDLDGTLVEELSVAQSGELRRASAFLLDALDLPQLRVTNVKPTKRSQPLSFYDIYAYCYVPQAEIDRSIVNHLDNTMRAKRVGAFELILGLTDESVSDARVRIGLLQDRIVDERRPLEAIDRFLAEAETPTEEQLTIRRVALQGRLDDANERLSSLRSESLMATVESSRLRTHLAEIAREVSMAAAEVQKLETEAASRRQLDAQLVTDLGRLERTQSANGVLGEIAYIQCPRCLQSVAPGRFAEDRCYVCGQPEPQATAIPEAATAAERVRVEALRMEVRELTAVGERELEFQFDRQRGLTVALREIEQELDRQTRELVSPRYEALERASADAATAHVEFKEIDKLLRFWTERERYSQQVADLEQELADVRIEHDAAVARLSERRGRVRELSDVFDEIIQALDMPWYQQGAYIDPTSYLPVVNGVSVEDLGSGGMKMMTNVAYHLALLTYGLSSNIETVPNLLIIDSPRKNLGSTDEDQAHAASFYRWITALTGAYNGKFQLIVADNDPPDAETPIARRINLSHSEPLVRDLLHPGEDVETIG
jgi:hypothetical protein